MILYASNEQSDKMSLFQNYLLNSKINYEYLF